METLQRTANRGSISTGGYDIDNSLKMEADNSESMTRTPSSSGNRKTWTLSFWFKRTELGAAVRLFEAWDGSTGTSALFTDADLFILDLTAGGNYFTSSAVFRDTSAWYHFVIRVDTTQGTASERARVYVNGSELAGSWNSNIGQNTDLTWNQNVVHYLGVFHLSGNFANGYYAEVINVDGTSLAPTEFGEFDADSGIWKPKAYTGSYGTNGFYLDFESSGSLGADSSGNGHTWTLNNITSADQATDTPTNNFCTINPLIPYNGSVSEGATKFIHTSGGNGWESFVATMGAGTSGKWYAEFKFVDSDNDNMIGICPIDDPDLNRGGASFAFYGCDSSLDESVGYYASDGFRYIGGGPASYGNSYNRTNIMSIAVDMDNGKLYFAKDGVWQNSGDPTSGATGTGALDVRGATKPQSLGASNYYSGEDILANYGGFTTISISTPETDENGYGTFEYAPPTGYYALCTKNLAEYG